MQLPDNWFQEWFNSPYYHQLYADRNEAEAACFIDRLLEHLRPALGSTMLDVACGRGRHARILAERGFDVTGIDLAPDSISYALQFANENLHFFEHDMRRLFNINYFDYAFNFFTSFGYFLTDRENNNAMRTISQSLKRNGIFVLDYLNVQYARENFIPQSTRIIDGTTFQLTKWLDEAHFYKTIRISENNGEKDRVFTEKVALFTLPDFGKMFALQGLSLQEVFGDYALHAFEPAHSPRLVMQVIKK